MDGKALLGTGQIVKNGTKFIHGAAYLTAEPWPGIPSIAGLDGATKIQAPFDITVFKP